MLFTKTVLAAALAMATGALAGQNCKCQDPSGTGPQYDAYTEKCCDRDPCYEDITPGAHFPGPNNQCSASGTNCIDSGAFVTCCKEQGAPGAYCWD